MPNSPMTQGNAAQAAINTIAICLVTTAALLGCAGAPSGPPLAAYRCEYGIEFTAKFADDSVVLSGTRGYDLLYRGGKYASTPAHAKPDSNEYSNARMQAEFNLGPTQREAIVRYPMLPLVSRCVRDN
jgi:hypothetical protein